VVWVEQRDFGNALGYDSRHYLYSLVAFGFPPPAPHESLTLDGCRRRRAVHAAEPGPNAVQKHRFVNHRALAASSRDRDEVQALAVYDGRSPDESGVDAFAYVEFFAQ
jgi:hypothetical protein